MSFINSIIKIFVGDKSQNDVKALQPYLTKIKGFESSLMALSNDELRARTAYFKEKIQIRFRYISMKYCKGTIWKEIRSG